MNAMKSVEVLNALARTSSRNEKLALLRSVQGSPHEETFKRLLDAGINPYTTYGIKPAKSWVKDGPNDPDNSLRLFFNLLDQLKIRELTGNAAKSAAQTLISDAPRELGEWMFAVLNKKMRCGVTAKTANLIWEGFIPTFGAMLCSKYRGGKIGENWWAEPKLDGMRTLLITDPSNPQALSRNGRPIYNQEHILEALAREFPGYVFDCELFAGSWEETMTAGKTQNGVADSGKLYVFDMIPQHEFESGESSMSLEHRRDALDEAMRNPAINRNVLIPTSRELVTSAEEIYKITEDLMGRGFEGAVIKDGDSAYEVKRSHSWLKVTKELLPGSNDHATEDFKIVDVIEGEGRLEGTCGALVCETADGVRFNCGGGPGMTDINRKLIWGLKFHYIGSYAQIMFREYTPYGKPRFPELQRLRTDK